MFAVIACILNKICLSFEYFILQFDSMVVVRNERRNDIVINLINDIFSLR